MNNADPKQINTGPPIRPEQMADCLTLPDRWCALKYMPRNAVTAEVGVAYGGFSRVILKELSPKKFYAVDVFSIKPGEVEFWGEDRLLRANMTHYEYYRKNFEKEIAAGKVEMRQGLSFDELWKFDDNYFDYVYLDAGHDYESVRKDILALEHKVKHNGFIQFNDYIPYSYLEGYPYGVVQAVNEFLRRGKHMVKYYCLHPYGYDDIVVQIVK